MPGSIDTIAVARRWLGDVAARPPASPSTTALRRAADGDPATHIGSNAIDFGTTGARLYGLDNETRRKPRVFAA